MLRLPEGLAQFCGLGLSCTGALVVDRNRRCIIQAQRNVAAGLLELPHDSVELSETRESYTSCMRILAVVAGSHKDPQ